MNAHFSPPNRGMRWIASGAFHMGAEWSNPKEASVHTVNVSGFLMDEHAFTNAVFALFVDATGYRRVANVGLIPPPIGRAVDGHHMAGDLLRSGSRPQWCLGPRIGRIIPVFATGAEGLGVDVGLLRRIGTWLMSRDPVVCHSARAAVRKRRATIEGNQHPDPPAR
jgi:formylglycine-generating enzyme required for sulfatase activity